MRKVLGFVLAWALSASADGAEWRVGIARTDITPKDLIWMAGYASRNHPAEGMLHPLWAKALAIEDAQGHRAVIVTADLIGFNRVLCERVVERIKPATGLQRAQVMFNASHTHSGPVIRVAHRITYPLDAKNEDAVHAYARTLEDKLVALVAKACASLRPAQLAFGEGKATFAMNRRSKRDKGYVIAPNPAGPVDHTVPVLRVSDEQGRLLAVLFGYACHNTTTSIYQFNGDYAGFAQIALEKAHPEATALFMIGCGGDSNPEPRGKIELAEAHGKALGEAVDRVLSGPMVPLAGPLRVAFDRVDLPFVDPPSKEELQKQLESKEVYRQRLAQHLLDQLKQKGSLPTSYAAPVHVIHFGSQLVLIGLPGETVVDYALRLRKELPGRRLWIAGYTNEVFAYLPSERVLAEGGYEGGGAMVYSGIHGPFKPGVEDRVIGLAKRLVTAEP